MSGLRRLLGGLAHRGPSTALLALIAVLAVTAATAAPVFAQAARLSTMRQALLAGSGADQLETTTQRTAGGTARLSATVHQVLDEHLSAAQDARYFAPDVLAEQGEITGPAQTQLLVVSRTGACAALHLLSGRCPTAAGEVIVSANAAALPEYQRGAVFRGQAGAVASLHIVGVYQVPDPNAPVWFAQGDDYFKPATLDAVFTVPATVSELRVGTVTLVDDLGLDADRVTTGSLGHITTAIADVLGDVDLSNDTYIPVSVLPATTATVHQEWTGITVTVVLITAELLVLVWMLLFLVVTEDVESRGAEIALAKLRGLPRRRVLATALSEPVTVLLVAIPVGVALGWVVGTLLAASALPAGVGVSLPPLAWATAGIAVLGGIAAVAGASRRVLRRGVLDQWRRTSTRGAARGWIFDAVLLTATAGGLVALTVSGAISSSSKSVQVEIVPGLVGLAAAVVLSRLLPLGARAVAQASRHRGGLASFLALRHIARRPAGTRTTIVLATAVAIAVFTTSAWDIGRSDRSYLAKVDVGAPVVASVSVTGTQDLASIVDAIDPSGRQAAAVANYTQGEGGEELLAVQPSRFAAVAGWPSSVSRHVITGLQGALAPPTVPPLMLSGSAVRFTVSGESANLAMATFVPMVSTNGSGLEPANGPVTMIATGPTTSSEQVTGALSNCPCAFDAISAEGMQEAPISGVVVFSDAQQLVNGSWQTIPGAFTRANGWQADSNTANTTIAVSDAADGTHWQYAISSDNQAAIEVADYPDPLPVVGAKDYISAAGTTVEGVGLDATSAFLNPVEVIAAVPGAPADGIIVDLTTALRASGGLDSGVQQVWFTTAGAKALLPKLAASGVTVTSTATIASTRAGFDQQGPALADTVLLFDAGAATVLAAIGAALSLAAAARRRRYEYASLVVGGASRWTVWRALVFEQAIVLGFGTVIGVGAGLVAVALAVSKLPILTSTPTVPALSYHPSSLVLLAALGLTVAGLALLALVSSGLLVRAVRTGTLRESAP